MNQNEQGGFGMVRVDFAKLILSILPAVVSLVTFKFELYNQAFILIGFAIGLAMGSMEREYE